MSNQQAEKLFSKSKPAAVYNGLDSAVLQKEVLDEFEKLLAENDLSNKMIDGHMTGSILPAVVLYRVLPTKDYTKTEARHLIRSSVLDSARPMAGMFQRLGRLPFFFPLLRIMCPMSMKNGFGDDGWAFEWKRNDSYAIEWDCTDCLYVNVFRQYQMSELAPIFCESDDVIYGNIPGTR